MSPGPLRRLSATLGLIALIPVAWMLVRGSLDPEEAALRAVVVGVTVILLGNVARTVVSGLLQRVERRNDGATADATVVFEPGQEAEGGRAGWSG